MEEYVNDLLVKRKKPKQHLPDLREALLILRGYQMKLNPLKCAFRLESGKLLGFMVSKQEIEATMEKVEAIVGMPFPCNLHEV